MRVSIIDKQNATIKVSNTNIKVDNQNIPFRLIDTLIIASNHTIQTRDLIKITKEDIFVILLSYDNKNSSLITSSKGKNSELKLSQYKALEKSLPIAKMFLRKKVISHIEQLNLHKIDIKSKEIFEKIQKADDIQTLLGIEGSFSKKYFQHYFNLFPRNLKVSKRTKNPPLDPLNAMLSFCYMIFYNLISIKLISYGFEPGIGFLHKAFRDHNALSSDLLEVFRADINQFVYEIFSQNIIKKEDFTKKNGVFLKYEGRKKLWKHLKNFIDKENPKIELLITEFRSML